MTALPSPVNEVSRIKTLHEYGILDTPPEQALDELTALAAKICNTPISVISLVDENRLWFKSKFGLPHSEVLRREDSFCAHAIYASELFIVPDATLDERFSDSPLVTEKPNVRFYAATSLVSKSGHSLGTLCVLDNKPRELDDSQKEALRVIGRQIMAHFELKFQANESTKREARLAMALDAARMGTFEWELSTNTVTWGGIHLELWDYSPEEFDGTFEAVRRRFHPDDHDSVITELDNCKNTNTPFNREFRVIWSDGSVHWISSQGEFDCDDSGNPIHMTGVVVEITDRRKAEEKLRNQKEILQNTGRVAKIGGWKFDPATNEASITDEVSHIYDFDPEAAPPSLEDQLSLFSDDSRKKIETSLEKATVSGTPYDIEVELTSAKGIQKFVRISGRPAEKSGDTFKVSGSIQDITERKQVENELILRNDALEHSVNGFYIINEHGKFVYANSSYRELWRYDTLEELLATSPFEHFFDPKVPEAINSALRSNNEHSVEFTALRKDGSTFEAQMSGRTIQDADGKQLYTGSVIDITEQKRANAAVKQSEEQLSSIVNSVEGIVWEANAETFEFSFVSPRAERLLGFPVSRWTDEPDFWPNQIHPDDRGEAILTCKAQTEKNQNHELEYRMITDDGNVVWIRDIVTVINKEGHGKKLRGVMIDISKQKEAEKRIQRLNRTHAVLSDINQVGLRQKDKTTFLFAACESAVEIGKFKMAWVGLKAPKDQSLKIEAHAGADSETLELLKILLGSADTKPACHFTVTALETGEHGVCNDIVADPHSISWREVTTARDIFSVASLPIKSGDSVIGTFNLYSSEVNFFDENEIRLLDQLVQDISFALEFRNREAERLRISKALETSESQLLNALKIAKLGHWEYDGTNEKVTFNERTFELFRTSLEKEGSYEMPVSRYVERFIHPDDFHIIERETKKSKDSDDPKHSSFFELRFILGDGSVGHFAVRMFSEKDSHGKTLRTYGVSQDITERKLSEEAINRVHKRYRALIEHSVDIVSLIDVDGNLLYTSPSITKVQGYDPDELVARNMTDRVHPEDAQIVREAFQEVAATPGASADFLVRSQHKDGHWLWLEGVGTNLLDDPAVGAIVANYRDVTSRKELEEELRQSQKLDAIGQLAGGVAHDFNNILTIIHGYGSMLLMEDDFNEENTDSVNQIIEASERATNLTRQLLAFSRRQVMQPRALDLNDSVTSLTKMLERVLGEDISLQLELHPERLGTRADAGMLDQILLNLVVNARDAMPDGGYLQIKTGSVVLSEEESAAIIAPTSGPHVFLSVTDNGTGISAENLSRIFEPFFTTKDQGKGTGLGLATVFGIVKQHNGALTVNSTLGDGTTFKILLPVFEDSNELKNPSHSKTVPKGKNEVILLVEDEDPVRNLVRIILERSGYQVIEAVHGVDALEVWKEHQDSIQLLLTDIVMPKGISGLELANILTEKSPNLRVVFTSGYSPDIAGRELELNEGQNFIQKPASRDQLLEIVRQSLDEEISKE